MSSRFERCRYAMEVTKTSRDTVWGITTRIMACCKNERVGIAGGFEKVTDFVDLSANDENTRSGVAYWIKSTDQCSSCIHFRTFAQQAETTSSGINKAKEKRQKAEAKRNVNRRKWRYGSVDVRAFDEVTATESVSNDIPKEAEIMSITIIQEGRSGFFGLGKKPHVYRVRYRFPATDKQTTSKPVGEEKGRDREEGRSVRRSIGRCNACIWYAEAALYGIYGKGICNYGSGQKPPFTMSPGDRVKIAWGNDRGCENFAGIDLRQHSNDRDIS